MRTTMRSALLLSATLVCALSWSPPAAATENLPPAITKHLALSYEPPCSLCHVEGKTGAGTATTPFARSARDRGLVAENVDILDAVLDRMQGARDASDADGPSDVEELIAGTDPNLPADGSVGPQTYGCVGRVASGHDTEPMAAGLFAALVLLWSRRRRTTSKSSPP